MYDKALIALIPSGYRDGGLYSVLPANGDGDFNFTRSSTATRVNKDGLIETIPLHTPRLDYPLTNGVVGDCPHLLLEPSRTNLFTYSEDFSQSVWTKLSLTATLTSKIAPDGNVGSVYNIVGTSANLFAGGTTGVEHTISFFIKSNSAGKDKFKLRLGNNTSNEFTATNEWIRYSFTSTPATAIFGITTSASPNNELDLLVWGAQSEQADYKTSYIKTSGSTVSRSADFCNLSGIGAEFNDSEGVLFAEISALANDGTTREIAISDGGASNRIEIRYISSANDIQAVIRGASSTIILTYNVTDATEFTKVAVKYKSEDYALWVGGVERAVSTTAGTPTGLNELAFDDGNSNFNMYGKCKQLIVFNEALSDSELQTLTS